MPDASPSDEEAPARSPARSLELALWLLRDQLAHVHRLDDKVGSTFTLNAGIVALLGATLGLTSTSLSRGAWWAAVAVLIVFGINGAVTIAAYRIREWSSRPDVEELAEIEAGHGPVQVEWWMLRELVQSIRENEPNLGRKARLGSWVIRLTVADAILAAATALAAGYPVAGA